MINSATRQRRDVVNHVARTRSKGIPGRRAGRQALERALRLNTPLNPAIPGTLTGHAIATRVARKGMRGFFRNGSRSHRPQLRSAFFRRRTVGRPQRTRFVPLVAVYVRAVLLIIAMYAGSQNRRYQKNNNHHLQPVSPECGFQRTLCPALWLYAQCCLGYIGQFTNKTIIDLKARRFFHQPH